jgi:hypothetical protein
MQVRRQRPHRFASLSPSCLFLDLLAVDVAATEAQVLTIDHKPTDAEELKRIKAAGATVPKNYVELEDRYSLASVAFVLPAAEQLRCCLSFSFLNCC